MILKTLFIVILSILLVNSVVSATEDCIYETQYECGLTISSSCDNSFKITNKKLFNCVERTASIFWSYPRNNLTIEFTYNKDANQKFELCLDTNLIFSNSVYHLVDENEIKVDLTKERVCFISDFNNNAVVLKAVAPKIMVYGQFITFDIHSLF